MRKTLLSTLALALLLGGASRLQADDLKPVAVVSLASYNTLSADLTFIGQVIDMPQLSKQLEAASAQAKGLDKTKPIGVAVMLDAAGKPQVVAFIGSTDLKALLSSLPFPPTDKGDGSFEINSPYGPVRAVQQGGWAVLTNAPDLLKSIPADPSALLGGMDKDYATAVRFNVQNVPAQTRDSFVGIMKFYGEAALQKGPDEDEAQFEMRKSIAESQIKQIEQIAHDLDQFTVGAAVNTEAKSVHLDMSMTFVAGSEMAKKAAQQAGGKSDFAGFLLPNAALSINFSEKLAPEDIEHLAAMAKSGRAKVQAQVDKDPSLSDEATKKAAKELVDQLFDIGDSAIKGGKMDGGAALILDPKALTFAAGGYLPEGASVEKTFKKFVELGQADPNFPPVKFDVETYKTIRFHSMAIPMNDPQGKQFFGDTLDAYLAVGEHSAYVAFGKGSVDLLKKVIDNSATSAGAALPPFQLNVALTPIVEFAGAMQPGNPGIAMIAQSLAASAGKDHVKITSKEIENGATVRIEAEEGVLKLIGVALKTGIVGGQAHP